MTIRRKKFARRIAALVPKDTYRDRWAEGQVWERYPETNPQIWAETMHRLDVENTD